MENISTMSTFAAANITCVRRFKALPIKCIQLIRIRYTKYSGKLTDIIKTERGGAGVIFRLYSLLLCALPPSRSLYRSGTRKYFLAARYTKSIHFIHISIEWIFFCLSFRRLFIDSNISVLR